MAVCVGFDKKKKKKKKKKRGVCFTFRGMIREEEKEGGNSCMYVSILNTYV